MSQNAFFKLKLLSQKAKSISAMADVQDHGVPLPLS
ncbi:Protein of unknown function [Bacillus wiedmannii]|uniref:Uncharacterized protein n=1 Tax=Bacillus wiedmannii TaxID=1890302 RepID=A0A1C6WN68_9BACI|nr:Protein of unknown function [Bacillus wiedmannii]SCL90118.1 Protein of unknown function [Bacillus wiedmannii]